ncbi:MAG TPA: hypothetical protein VI959_03195 [Alphaproteobacteria bacterium]|nr:hypothetical protein [Alphaproteobacteria bacterium]
MTSYRVFYKAFLLLVPFIFVLCLSAYLTSKQESLKNASEQLMLKKKEFEDYQTLSNSVQELEKKITEVQLLKSTIPTDFCAKKAKKYLKKRVEAFRI